MKYLNKQFKTNRTHAESILTLIGIILIFVIQAGAQVCTPAPVGLISWFEGENNLRDSRSRNDSTTVNPMAYAPGKVGQAFSIPGVSSANHWDVPDDPSLNPQTLTVEAWIKTPGNGSDAGFIASKSGADAGHGFELFFNFPGGLNRLRFDMNGGAGGADISGSANITDNVFHHVAATYDGATMKLYVDGVLDAQKAVTVTISYQAGHPFTIDNREYPSLNMPGVIDELGFYNRALSQAEIQAIVDAGTAGKCKPTATAAPSGLVGWWGGDGDGHDISGNANDGTLSNGARIDVAKSGQGFRFDEPDDKFTIADSNDLDLLTGGTVEMWMYANDTSNSTIIAKGRTDINQASYSWMFYNGNLRFDLYKGDGSLNYQPVTTPAGSMVGTWTHIAVNWDTSTIAVFVNGVQVASAPYSFIRQDTPYLVILGQDVSGQPAFSGKLDEVSIYNRPLSLDEISSIYQAGLGGKLKTAITPVGFARASDKTEELKTSADLSPELVNSTVGDATVSFQSVTSAGTTQEIPLDLAQLPTLPMGLSSAGLTYDISTSAGFIGAASVCFNLASFTPSQFIRARAYHLESGIWIDRTAPGNTYPSLCTTGVTSLSPFAIVLVAPTAANVSVSGRVAGAQGNGIPNVRVSIMGVNGVARTALTSPFGYYSFDSVAAGQTYIVSVASKQHQFNPSTRVVSVEDSVDDVNFTADQ